MYSKDVIRSDSCKIEDMRKMPAPQDTEVLQRFIGLMIYLAEYIPHFADNSQRFENSSRRTSIRVSRRDVSTANRVRRTNYRIQRFWGLTPRSQNGLGVCLNILQDNNPIAFASKTLTSTQSAYSNIERETLAIVNGVTAFHTYLFGKPFVIISDHITTLSS